MSAYNRHQNLAAMASEYIDRRFKDGSVKTNTRSTGKKSSKVAKEYIQAYEWAQKELMKSGNTSKRSTTSSSSIRKPQSTPDRGSLTSSTRRSIPRETLSPITFSEMLESDDEHMDHPTPLYDNSERILAPQMSPRFQRVDREPSVRSIGPTKQRAPRRSALPSIVPILLAITFMAICEHMSHIMVRTDLLSDLGLQFAAFFLKTTLQVLIVMYLLAKVKHDGDTQDNDARRCAFRNFMHSQGGRMIEADKLRTWFGETAVFDSEFLAKWTDENRCEYWQCRQTQGTH